MIKTPHIFSQIKGQSFSANTSLGSKPLIYSGVSPKTFQTIYVIALAVYIFTLTVFYQTMDIAPGCDTGVTLLGVGADNRTTSYSFINLGRTI